MTLDELKALRESGEFHHATHRIYGNLWDGLWIYKKDPTGWGGYSPAGVFYKNSPDIDEAHNLVRDTGVSLGQYGGG